MQADPPRSLDPPRSSGWADALQARTCFAPHGGYVVSVAWLNLVIVNER
jgi:hypothetical protein